MGSRGRQPSPGDDTLAFFACGPSQRHLRLLQRIDLQIHCVRGRCGEDCSRTRHSCTLVSEMAMAHSSSPRTSGPELDAAKACGQFGWMEELHVFVSLPLVVQLFPKMIS